MNEDYCFFKTKICFVKTHELHKPTKNFMKRLDKKVIRKFIFQVDEFSKYGIIKMGDKNVYRYTCTLKQ